MLQKVSVLINNWPSGIRTHDCRSQSPVPYRLAMGQYNRLSLLWKKSLLMQQGFEGWIEGFEPSASRATIWRANQLRYTHHRLFRLFPEKKNVPKGIRTPDPRLRRPLLYPTELLAHRAGDGNRTHVSSLEGWCSTIELHPQMHRGDRIRTCDLLIPNQAL